MVSGVQESQWACLLLVSSFIPSLNAHLWHSWVFLSHSFRKGAGVLNTAIQDMAGHAAVTDSPQDLCHLPHNTLSLSHARFQINLFGLYEALCPQCASAFPLWLSTHLPRSNILYLFLDQIHREVPAYHITQRTEKFE